MKLHLSLVYLTRWTKVDLDAREDTPIFLLDVQQHANLPNVIGIVQVNTLVTWTAAHHPLLSRQPFLATSTIPEAGIQYPGAEQALSRCCAGS